MNLYTVAAQVDIGHERENQEDFVQFQELDDDTLFAVIADGTGSLKDLPQPGAIVSETITEVVRNTYLDEDGYKLFLENPMVFLRIAMDNANRVLGGFKMGNEERFSGYAASVTCVFIHKQNIYYAHAGNTRLYILRNGKLKAITRDHTRAYELLKDGTLTMETYYVSAERLRLTSCIGMVLDPEIQLGQGRIKENDILILTTDGIHYAIRPDIMEELILGAQNANDACAQMIEAQRSTKYPDNAGIMMIHRRL